MDNRSAIVPAQITTVEDKVFANLSFIQVALLGVPLLIGLAVTLFCLPFMKLAAYKVVIDALLLIPSLFAIRRGDELLIYKLVRRVQFNRRARYFTFDKSDGYLRSSDEKQDLSVAVEAVKEEEIIAQDVPEIPIADRVRLEAIMRDPQAGLRYVVGKNGRLDVIIQEVK